nr:hypothetical protein [Bradyrhizobium sp. CCH5-A9]
MAQTFIGNLILRLQENVSAGAKKAAGALRGLDAAARQIGGNNSGAAKLKQQIDGITTAAQRMASVPWGANVQAQFNRLGAGAKDLDKIRQSWDALQARISAGGLTGKLRSNEIAAWRQSVVGHLTAVRAQAKSTQSAFAAMQRGMVNAMKPVYTAAGLGTGAYVAGRLGRSGLTAASERQREYFRQEMGGMPADEREKIALRAAQLSQQFPSVDQTSIMEMARSGRNTMGDTDRGLAILEAMTKGQVTLQSARGVDTASAMMSRLIRGIDNLGQNASGELGIRNTRDIIDGVIKAVQIEGRELDPGALFDFARRAKIAGPALDTKFIMNAAPAFMQDMTAQGFGAALSSAYQSFVIGARSVNSRATLAEQRRLGIRQGPGHGTLVDSGEFGRDPYSWVKKNLIPRLEKDGVNLNDDTAVAEAVAKLSNNTNATGLITRMIQQREQIDRLMGLYAGSKGVDAANEAAGKDPFVAYQGIISSLNNLSAAVGEGVMPIIVPGLNALSGAINAIAGGIQKMDPTTLTALGGAGLAAGAFAGYKVVTGVAAMLSAGPALNVAAGNLTAAAVALQGGAVAGAGGAAAGAAAGGAGAGWAARLLGMARIGGIGALIAGYYDLFSKGMEPDAGDIGTVKPGQAHNNYLEKRRKAAAAFKAEQDAERERVLPWSESNREARRGKAFSGLGSSSVDTSSIDEARAKAASAGAEIVKGLGVTVAPQVDSSSLDAVISKARQAAAALQGLGSIIDSNAARAGESVGRALRSAQSDYGVAQ